MPELDALAEAAEMDNNAATAANSVFVNMLFMRNLLSVEVIPNIDITINIMGTKT